MLCSDSLREMMQNAVNESFSDAHGVEIGPCAAFKKKVTFQDIDFFQYSGGSRKGGGTTMGGGFALNITALHVTCKAFATAL